MNGTNHIQPQELQAYLREFGGPLATVEVKPKYAIAPWIVDITGGATIHGQPFYFETLFSLREIGGPEHIVALAGLLLQSFQKAEKGIPRDAH